MSKIKDLTGQRFEKLVVLNRSSDFKGKPSWDCLCDCGKEIHNIPTRYLTCSYKRSCGCYRKRKNKEFEIGQRFGYGVIIKESKDRATNGCILWELLCDCGNVYTANTGQLLRKEISSCGCFRKRMSVINGKKNAFLIKVSESDKINEWDFEKNKILPSEITIGSGMKAWWICEKCNYSWNAIIQLRFYANRGCPQCNESHGEKIIRTLLNKKNIKYEQEKTFDDCKDKRSLRFDFYLPDYNLCIEFQGKQHYLSVEQFGGQITLKERQRKDEIKREFCLNKSIPLLEIPYWEIKNIEDILTKALTPNNET